MVSTSFKISLPVKTRASSSPHKPVKQLKLSQLYSRTNMKTLVLVYLVLFNSWGYGGLPPGDIQDRLQSCVTCRDHIDEHDETSFKACIVSQITRHRSPPLELTSSYCLLLLANEQTLEYPAVVSGNGSLLHNDFLGINSSQPSGRNESLNTSLNESAPEHPVSNQTEKKEGYNIITHISSQGEFYVTSSMLFLLLVTLWVTIIYIKVSSGRNNTLLGPSDPKPSGNVYIYLGFKNA